MSWIPAAVITGIVIKAYSDHKAVAVKAAAFRPLVKRFADQYGLSEHILVGLIWRESRFNPEARGSAGEVGLTQFKPIAAADVGMDFEKLKRDPAMQIEAACRLLVLNYKRSGGDLFTSIRAFNRGIGAASNDPAAGSEYLLGVLKVAAADWIYNLLEVKA